MQSNNGKDKKTYADIYRLFDKKSLNSSKNWENLRDMVTSKQKTSYLPGSLDSPYNPSVVKLMDYINGMGQQFLRITFVNMLKEANELAKDLDNTMFTYDLFFTITNEILRRPPKYSKDFMDALPFFQYYSLLMLTKNGHDFFTNNAINRLFQEIFTQYSLFLDTDDSASVPTQDVTGWLSPDAVEKMKLPDYKLYDPSKKHGGFKSFNDFFIREFKNFKGSRPIDSTITPCDIVSPVDGRVHMCTNRVSKNAQYEIKNDQYFLKDLLQDETSIIDEFDEGTAIQIVLYPYDYHRWHSPIDGTVEKIKTIAGSYFAALDDTKDYANSFPFLAHVNSRLIFILNPTNQNIGKVILIFVGLTEVSSCKPTVQENGKVQRGDELGYFQ